MENRKAGNARSEVIAFLSAAVCIAAAVPSSAETINGDHTISADTTLAEDLTVTGTLTLENGATIDLQGHKLTAAGLANNSQNIVINGDFEADPSWGEVANSSWSYYAEAQSFTPPGMGGVWEGWKNPTHGGGIAKKGSAFAHGSLDVNGKYCAFLHTNANAPATKGRYISQDLTISAAGLYMWSFRYAQRAGAHGALPFNFNLIHGSATNTLCSATPSSQTSFSTASGTVEVDETGTFTLQFIATDYGDNSTLFDDVVLRQVAAITDTSTGAPGELRLVVPGNTTFENDGIAVSGNLNFVKDGTGAFTCATAGLMTYLGNTYVAGGTYVCGLNGSQHPFGGKNLVVNGDFETDPSTGAITNYKYYNSGNGPTFEWSGWGESSVGSGLAKKSSTFVGNIDVGTYAAFVHGPGGSGRCIAQKLSAIPAGAYNLSFKYAASRATCKFDCLLDGTTPQTFFTGKSVSKKDSWETWSDIATIGESGFYTLKFRISSTSASGYNPGIVIDDVVFERITDVHIAAGATLDLNGKTGFGAYTFVGHGGVIVNSGAGISETLAVSGVFAPVASTGSFGVELQDGATLDLSAWTGDLPFTGVAFASGATITVNLAGRADLRKVAKSKNPYVVTWAAQPDATFALDSATASRCKVNAEDSGLRIEFVDGFVLVIR